MPGLEENEAESSAPLVPRTDTTTDSDTNLLSVDEALSMAGVGRFQAFMAAILGFALMFDAAEILLLSFIGPDIKCEWNISGTEESLLTMVVFIGMAFGSTFFGTLSDNVGRRPASIADITLVALASIASGFAPNLWTLIFMRFITGIGLGGFILLMSMFSEFLPLESRGMTLGAYQLFWSVGGVLEAAIAWIAMPRYHWRGLIIISAIPLCCLCLVLPLIPESPRYLAVKGKTAKAMKILRRIAKVNGNSIPATAELQISMEKPDDHSSLRRFFLQFKTLFEFPLIYITPILWWSWVSASLAYYSIVILTTSIHAEDEHSCEDGHSNFLTKDYLSIMIDTSGEIVGILSAVFLLDYFGRKRMLLWEWYGCSLVIFLLPISVFLETALLFLARAFSMGVFTAILVMAPELYPSSYRSFAVGMGNLVSRAGAAASPFVAQAFLEACGLLVTSITLGVFFFIAGTMALLIPLETSGKPMYETLQEVQTEIESSMNWGESDTDIEQSMPGTPSGYVGTPASGIFLDSDTRF